MPDAGLSPVRAEGGPQLPLSVEMCDRMNSRKGMSVRRCNVRCQAVARRAAAGRALARPTIFGSTRLESRCAAHVHVRKSVRHAQERPVTTANRSTDTRRDRAFASIWVAYVLANQQLGYAFTQVAHDGVDAGVIAPPERIQSHWAAYIHLVFEAQSILVGTELGDDEPLARWMERADIETDGHPDDIDLDSEVGKSRGYLRDMFIPAFAFCITNRALIDSLTDEFHPAVRWSYQDFLEALGDRVPAKPGLEEEWEATMLLEPYLDRLGEFDEYVEDAYRRERAGTRNPS